MSRLRVLIRPQGPFWLTSKGSSAPGDGGSRVFFEQHQVDGRTSVNTFPRTFPPPIVDSTFAYAELRRSQARRGSEIPVPHQCPNEVKSSFGHRRSRQTESMFHNRMSSKAKIGGFAYTNWSNFSSKVRSKVPSLAASMKIKSAS